MSQHDVRLHRTVLVVESEPVIAMDLAAELVDHGVDVAGPFSNSADALVWLESSKPDCAIIDAGLRDGSGFEIARQLRRGNVPFMFFSDAEAFEPEAITTWSDAPWLGKPISSSHVVRILEGLPCSGLSRDATGREPPA